MSIDRSRAKSIKTTAKVNMDEQTRMLMLVNELLHGSLDNELYGHPRSPSVYLGMLEILQKSYSR